MIVAILNQKGGSGKSTLATNLARALQLSGRRVLIADADPQASALAWRESYVGEDAPAVVGVDRDHFDADVRAVASAFDVVFIDGAPRMDERNRAALRVADLVIVPVQPTAFDVKATAPLVRMIEAQQAATPGRPRSVFIVSRQIPGSNLAGEASGALAAYGLPVLKARTSQRVAYPEAAALGVSVLDYEPGGKAAEEIQAIAEELWPR